MDEKARYEVFKHRQGKCEYCGTRLKWDAYDYRSWWQGTLNEATGNSITLHTDGSYIVYLTYQAKE